MVSFNLTIWKAIRQIVKYKSINITAYVVLYQSSLTATSNSCNTGKSALPDMYARCPRASADISGNARFPVLQLICYTSGGCCIYLLTNSIQLWAAIVTFTFTCRCHRCSQSNYVKMNCQK